MRKARDGRDGACPHRPSVDVENGLGDALRPSGWKLPTRFDGDQLVIDLPALLTACGVANPAAIIGGGQKSGERQAPLHGWRRRLKYRCANHR